MCSLDCCCVLPRRRHACRWRAAETKHLAPAPRQTQPSSVQREQAAVSTPTSSQVRLHDERNSPPAARFMLAHEASTLTRFDLCLLCRLAAAATAAAGQSPGSAVLPGQSHRTAASFPPERFSPLGRADCCVMPLLANRTKDNLRRPSTLPPQHLLVAGRTSVW
jgi:hypothetical protein